MWDAVIYGGGPAGATLARLLAKWGHRVLLCAGQRESRARAESLPPSIRNLFDLLGIREDIETAGFWKDGGNTSWWTSDSPRVEHFPPGATGYHVDRRTFDDLLLRLASNAGVTVIEKPPGDEDRRFSVDCSGRSGYLARSYRVPDMRYRTACLSSTWTGEWDTEPTHALVEAYADGWAWSVPLDGGRRQLAFMVDHGRSRGGASKAYADELAKTRVFRDLFARAAMGDGITATDASLYYSKQYAGSSWLLAGDAGSAVDPLSSFGVKKALISAWLGAVVVNTCLTNPTMADHAIQLYNDRERRSYADHARQAAMQFGELTGRFATPFWQKRAVLGEDLQLYEPAALARAHDELRRSERLRLRLRKPLESVRTPAVAGREVVLHDRLVIPGLAPTVEYIQGVNLTQLALIAEAHDDVPALFEAYNRANSAVALPNFISALSFLLASGILKNTSFVD